ncbi:MAG: single-stranded DNA-binding protein [Candidatus Marinimicrobia bacterium]|nr:single-stranded DNA-binding protein [Candidatus Neomarinimicrobiota bacterium]
MNRNSANRVILVGHIGMVPEVKTVKNDRKVSHFTVASNYRWKDPEGNIKTGRTGTVLSAGETWPNTAGVLPKDSSSTSKAVCAHGNGRMKIS